MVNISYTHSQSTNCGKRVSILISRSYKRGRDKRNAENKIHWKIKQETTLNLVYRLTQLFDASPRQRRQFWSAVSIGGFVVLSTGIKLLPFFCFQKLSQIRKVEFFSFCLERVFSLERFFPSRGFFPREAFSLERIFPSRGFRQRGFQQSKFRILTCRFLVVNQVHCKGPSMV